MCLADKEPIRSGVPYAWDAWAYHVVVWHDSADMSEVLSGLLESTEVNSGEFLVT
jgi:hypothetical protein